MFLLWPLLLACVMPLGFWSHLPTMFGYLLIVALCCITTSTTALFCSTIFRKSATSLISTYVIILVLFAPPVAAGYFANSSYQDAGGVAEPCSSVPRAPSPRHFRCRSKWRTTRGSFIRMLRPICSYSSATSVGRSCTGTSLLMMMRLFQVRWAWRSGVGQAFQPDS